jgi:dipeptidyl aminopeptidase/acylaminoacyl peptidase
MDSPKYAKVDIIKTPYKDVNSHEIDAYILIPKNITLGKYPLIANFHGGFFVS